MLSPAMVEMDMKMHIQMHDVDIHHPGVGLTGIGVLRINRSREQKMILKLFFSVDEILDQCL